MPIVALEVRGEAVALRLLHKALARRRGLRRTLAAGRLALEVDAPVIERVGPEVEALATAAGLELRLVDLDARLASTSLDGRPSGVWAAIGDAALDLELARERGDATAPDLYGRVAVRDEAGRRTASDGRPPRVEPIGRPPDLSPTKYDDHDYHDGAAVEAGQPAEHGATHIGLFLSWLVRHDLHEPDMFDDRDVAEVRAGTMAGSDLLGLADGKLLSDMLTDEGIAFCDARYEPYLDAYGELFADAPDYSIEDDAAAEALVHPLIDGIYRDWVAAGRPAAAPSPDEEIPEAMRWVETVDIGWDAITQQARDFDGPTSVQLRPDGTYRVEKIEPPHDDPALEAFIPDDLGDGRVTRSSGRGAQGDVRLKRALATLGVTSRRVTTAFGIAGKGPRVILESVYRVPGIDAATLVEAFGPMFRARRGREVETRDLEGGPVHWVDLPPDLTDEALAFWALDGLVISVGADPALLPAAIARIRAVL